MSDRNEGHHGTHSERIWYPSAPRSHHTPSILVFSSSSPPNNYTAQKTNRKTQQKTIHPRLTPQKAPFTPAYGSHAGNPVILLISLIFCVMILTKPHDNHVFQRLSRTCSSQQEIIFANFQACIQAFMPGYRLLFTLLLGESLGGIQKPNIKPNTEPFPNCCFSHDKGVLGSNSRDAFTLRILSYSVPKLPRFLAFFQKTNEKPYSHDIHALTRKSRQSIIFTLDLN